MRYFVNTSMPASGRYVTRLNTLFKMKRVLKLPSSLHVAFNNKLSLLFHHAMKSVYDLQGGPSLS